jgi:adenylate cyclase
MCQSWPWNREIYALIGEKLIAAGARVVAIDFTFPKPTPSDDRLRKLLEAHPDRFVVAGNLERKEIKGGGSRFFNPPAETVVPPSLRDKDVVCFDNFFALLDERVRGAVFRELIDDVKQTGEARETRQAWLSLAAGAVKKSGYPHHIPANPDTEYEFHRMRFSGPEGAFRPRSAHEIFAPRTWRGNFANGEFFKDKIVIVGPHGNWSQDYHATTLGIMPGPELHLNAMNVLLTGEYCRMTGKWGTGACLFGAGFFAWLAGIVIRRPWLRFIYVLAIPIIWWAAAVYFYNTSGLFLPTVAPIAIFGLSGMSNIVADQVFERMEKVRVRRTLERYVSKNVVGELLARRDEFAAGIVKPVTVLFSDIRNFTKFSAQTEPNALVRQLNEYFTAMVECVFAHGGTVDKFMGDAVMAVWGNATSGGLSDDAKNATKCAFAMHKALANLNKRWASEGREKFQIGIALNHGNAVVGDIGSPNKMEFTVIGDAVNIAWRLQERTKDHPEEVIIGNALPPLLGSEFTVLGAGTMTVGGTLEIEYSIVRQKHPEAAHGLPMV